MFRLPQGFDVMAYPIVEHMKKTGVKTLGFLGYTDAYGELWLKEITPAGREGRHQGGRGRALRAHRHQRHAAGAEAGLGEPGRDPGRRLRLRRGDAAQGAVERGYKGKIYQTHAAATPDLMRIGGKDVEGSFVVSGPAVVAEQLPDNHPSKKLAVDFVTKYEKAVGKGSRNQFAGHALRRAIVLEKVMPMALKKAKPGTPEFRAALRDAIETMGRTIFAHGVMNWTSDDHWGYTNETGVLLKVVDGKFVVVK